ncbi:MAG: MmgE/PrpD family protein [Acidobacteria bacterium]|nr:MAG: MmgE/PrpD family protein [Acidobacteriota bacterium]
MTRKEFLKLTSMAAAAPVSGASGVRDSGGVRLQPDSAQPRHAFPTGVTAAVVEFIQSASFDRMPQKATAEAKRCLIDGFGVVLAGSTVRGSEIVREHVTTRACGSREESESAPAANQADVRRSAVAGGDGAPRAVKNVDGFGDSTILGPRKASASAAQAALANAASGHAMDYDDTQLSSTPDRVFGLLTHPTVPVLAASLAGGERLGVSGRAFLEAFLTGFEVECKIAEAINPRHYVGGFHSTGTIGTFGAAASAAKLLKLTRPQSAHALGIAASMSSGLRVNFGSMTKPLHAGRAAENGVTAAELASRGFTAGDDGLDGEWGFFQVMGGGADLSRIVPALGKPFSIVDPGVSFKPYPCGSLGHPTMDAMLKLVTDHDVKPDRIARVRVRAGSNILNPLRYKTAKSELEAKFCLPFMMASIALRRRAGIREFTDEFVSSPAVQAMMSRVDTVFDQAIEARGFDKMRSIVEIDLADGRKLSQPSDERYRGGPERPFTREELHEKFTDCASLILSSDRIKRALDAIESVDQLKSIRDLTAALVQA